MWLLVYNESMTARTIRYKGMPVNLLGIPDFSTKQKTEKQSRPKRLYLRSFSSNFKNGAPKNLLLIYDVPEGKKKERDWFRRQLKNFDFVMIQRSVWVGPSPLPKNFLDYLNEINLRKDFKTFKLARPYHI